MSRHIYIHKNTVFIPVVVPTVQIVSITNITSNGATILARVVNDGGSSITDYRFYFYAPLQPAVDVHVSPNPDGTFSYTGSTLAANTQYYLTASATNSMGSGSASQYFTTLSSAVVPTIRINSMGNITANSANVNCEILSAGGGTISVSGICWNTTGNPTTANSKTTDGITELGTFYSVMSGLQAGTTYHVRGYATNQAGTAYTADYTVITEDWILCAQFQTNSPATKAFTPAISFEGSYKWDLGDGTIAYGLAVNHTYSDNSIKTVKLYYQASYPHVIGDVIFNNQNIVGTLDLSHAIFKTCIRWSLSGNDGITSLISPDVVTGAVTSFSFNSAGITGVLNLSAFVNLSEGAIFSFQGIHCSSIIFGTTLSGKMLNLLAPVGFLAGTLDLSPLAWADNFKMDVQDNPGLINVVLGSSVASSSGMVLHNCSIDYLNISSFPNASKANNFALGLFNNSMTAAQVNRILAELDSVAVSGYTGRIVNFSGTNAAPDSNSGGYNGTASKAALISKGFSVYTN